MKIKYRIVPHKPLLCEFVKFKVQRKSVFFWHTMSIKYDLCDAKHDLDMCIEADVISNGFENRVARAAKEKEANDANT